MISNLYVAAEKEIAAYNFGMTWWVIHEGIFICIPFKVIVHQKMKILSSFTHPHVIPNLYGFLFYVEHRIYFEECW